MRLTARLIVSLLVLGLGGGLATLEAPNLTAPPRENPTQSPAPTATASPANDASPSAPACQQSVTAEESPNLGGVVGMSFKADLIAEGTVTGATPPAAGPDGSVQSIATDYFFHIEEALAGDADGTVRVRRAGGQVGCRQLLNAVSPVLNVGDHLLLFLERDHQHPEMLPAYDLLGQGQGYWQLRTESTPDGPLAIAAKFYRSDTGIFGDPQDRELVQEISDRVRKAIAAGPPTPDNSEALSVAVNVDYLSGALRPDQLAESTGLIVTGKVIDSLPPRWPTPDGARPVNFTQMVPEQYTTITPVVVELDASPIINSYGPLVDSRQIVVATERGQVDGNSVELGPELVKGEHVLLFLSCSRYLGSGFGRFATERGLAWNVNTLFFVDDGQIYSPFPFVKWEPLSDFITRVRASGLPAPHDDQ